MGIVELYLIKLGKFLELVIVLFFIPLDDIIEGSRAEEILLLESQLLASIS
jgi:hypothetical protein